MTDPTIRAAIYARFSSDKQNERSIADQVALCRALCKRAGYNVAAVYEDRAVSGASTVKRMGWRRLMRDAAARAFDVVVAEDQDRIARDEEDWHAARKRLAFLEIQIHTSAGTVSRLEGGMRAMMNAVYLENLALHVHRSLAGNVREGKSAGGRSYGYRPIPGQPGKLQIVEDEAKIVRHIFKEYVAGKSPREIAAKLNMGRIAGPRGGHWNASTIGGSRKRLNGVLQNALYRGQMIWNRQRFIRNPDTATRVSRPNENEDRIVTDVPELRIVDDATFNAAQARRAQRGGERRYTLAPRHLLSGLLKCGCCGSGYIVSGADKRGKYLRCSRMVETGLCNNKRTVSLDAVEKRIIEGIEKELAAPDAIAAYVTEYHRLARAKAKCAGTGKRRLERRLQDVDREAYAIVMGIGKGTIEATHATGKMLKELDNERNGLLAAIEAVKAPPVEIHPHAADVYRRKVRDLKKYLTTADPEARNEALRILRELVEKVVIRPQGAYKPVEYEVHGRLAALLRISEGAAKSPQESMGLMVAGARNQRCLHLNYAIL